MSASAFETRAQRHRRELHVHCYRMLGSFEEAEDAVQETLLRAWRGQSRVDSEGGFRPWLYRIATNHCLDVLRRRKRRPQAIGSFAEIPWLQPYPDRLLDVAAAAQDEPEAVVTAKETIELAFLAAIQRLPARQRAVLILRDTLDWPVSDTAVALGISQAAVNSALQRARAALAAHLPPQRAQWRSSPTPVERRALRRLITAWESADTAALVALLRDDAKLIMPPGTVWFAGRRDIGSFLGEHVFGEMGARLAAAGDGGQSPARLRAVLARSGRGRVPGVRHWRAAGRRRRRRRDRPVPAAGAVRPVRPAPVLVMSAGVRRRTVNLPPRGGLDCAAADWADALVVVERGELELECRSGRRARFAAGAVLTMAGLPVRSLRNPGPGPLVLSAVTRCAPHR